jgi:hypothetical protein
VASRRRGRVLQGEDAFSRARTRPPRRERVLDHKECTPRRQGCIPPRRGRTILHEERSLEGEDALFVTESETSCLDEGRSSRACARPPRRGRVFACEECVLQGEDARSPAKKRVDRSRIVRSSMRSVRPCLGRVLPPHGGRVHAWEGCSLELEDAPTPAKGRAHAFEGLPAARERCGPGGRAARPRLGRLLHRRSMFDLRYGRLRAFCEMSETPGVGHRRRGRGRRRRSYFVVFAGFGRRASTSASIGVHMTLRMIASAAGASPAAIAATSGPR